MSAWALRLLLFVLAFGVAYWFVFTVCFFKDVVPHGGMW
jgi:hypothetical protein